METILLPLSHGRACRPQDDEERCVALSSCKAIAISGSDVSIETI